jgi:hypothetical protein
MEKAPGLRGPSTSSCDPFTLPCPILNAVSNLLMRRPTEELIDQFFLELRLSYPRDALHGFPP